MEITLEISDGTVCAFFSGVRVSEKGGMEMFCHQIDSNDLMNGKTIKLPREDKEDGT